MNELFHAAYGHHCSGDLTKAEQLYHRILGETPLHFDALYGLSVLHAQKGEYPKALERIEEALYIHNDNAMVFYHQGRVLRDLQRLDEALESYDKALLFNPHYADALHGRGYTLHDLNRFNEALASYNAAIAIKPDYAEAYYNLGNTLFSLHRYNEALVSYDTALHFKPHYAQAFNNRGAVLENLQHIEEALLSYTKAIAIKPNYAEAFYNCGVILQVLKRFEEALDHYTVAISLKANYAEAINNRGTILRTLMRFEEALTQYDMAISLKPDYAEAHYNKSLCALLLGRFNSGWTEYAWRVRVENMQERLGRAKHDDHPSWQGDRDILGKTILLHVEQGMGDILQFCRYAQRVAEWGANVILEVPAVLKTLMLSLAGPILVVARGEMLPAYDMQCSIMDLPLIFATRLNSIPASIPYLRAEPSRMRLWKDKLALIKGRSYSQALRIGLAWSGNSTHDDDQNRSIPLELLLPVSALPFQFYSLQKEVREADQQAFNRSSIQDFSTELEDFSDTAAFISQMDLIISVDTSVAHLAGALGKPVWILLAAIPDWRWLLDREDSPWYPTARLFRQTQAMDWIDVVEQVCEALLVISHPF